MVITAIKKITADYFSRGHFPFLYFRNFTCSVDAPPMSVGLISVDLRENYKGRFSIGTFYVFAHLGFLNFGLHYRLNGYFLEKS